MTEPVQWEYRAISVGSFWRVPNDEELEFVLDELGVEGWEVVSAVTQYGTNKVRVVAKRPLSGNVRRQRDWPG